MIRLVSWNIDKRVKPWRDLKKMAHRKEVDVALLQEAGSPPGDLAHMIQVEDDVFWSRHLHDRWPLVAGLSDRVKVEGFRQVPPTSELGEGEIGVSGIGTMAVAKTTPLSRPEEEFLAVSMYARWMKPHPSTRSVWKGASDVSAHRILSDLSAFVGHSDPEKHRILAAGDLNMFYGATCGPLSLPERERTVWSRFKALGLEFLGPQAPDGRPAAVRQPDVDANTRNVPTCRTRQQSPAEANRQLDYVFASRGFHELVTTRALNGIDEWGSSDHCRILIEVDTG
ncbi:MAG: hypothetical protein F4145_19875 [Boseongicola sp. SB0675_bin_26]|nr:hypothetical protein [Boseongicola sp. SB0675_bin_26]